MPEVQLHNVLTEWRRLAHAEGQAIREGNWPFVGECRKALAALRQDVDRLTAKPAPAGGSLNPATKSVLRATVLELIELQQRNLNAIQKRRQQLSDYIRNLATA